MNHLEISLEQESEYREVENLVRESFWNVYRPGCYEHYVLHQLRNDQDFIKNLDFVLKLDGQIIGQIIFVSAKIETDHHKNVSVLTMGPLCIHPHYQRKGYGKFLLDYALDQASKLGYGAVFIEGNIDFYGQSGFVLAKEYGICYPGMSIDENVPYFLGKELVKGYLDCVTGEYVTPSGYFVDNQDVEEFDMLFDHKEKLKLPGQLF